MIGEEVERFNRAFVELGEWDEESNCFEIEGYFAVREVNGRIVIDLGKPEDLHKHLSE